MEEAARRTQAAARELLTDHQRHNRAFWDADADAYQALHGDALRRAPLAWGAWRAPETEVRALGDVAGRTMLELGCGAAEWSIALARAGAHVVGLDQSASQLRHAHGQGVPLVLATGEATPFTNESFDVVFCDHGAMSFCDPERSVPEAARLLRPDGLLVFCHTAPLLYLTWDEEQEEQTDHLLRDYFGIREFRFGEGTHDFQLPHGEWIGLFRRHGFMVEDLVELRPAEGAVTTYADFAPYDWARRWPAEQVWRLRKVSVARR